MGTYDELGAGAEVFSTTEVISKQTRDKEILDRKLGKDPVIQGQAKRKKFLHREFASLV